MIAWLLAHAAQAGGLGSCGSAAPIAGTPSYDAAVEAISTHAGYWGTVALAEREVFPYLARPRDDSGWNFSGRISSDATYLFGAAQVPSAELSPECPAGVAMRDVDMANGSFALGIMYGRLGGFYGSSATLSGMVDAPMERYATAYAFLPIGHVAGMLGPVVNAFPESKGLWSYEPDWMGGLVFDGSDYGSWRLGWSKSQGLVTNLTQERLRLLLAAVVSPSLDSMPFLRAGLDRLPTEGGLSSALYRKMTLAETEEPDEPDGASFHTVTLTQQSILGILDVGGAMAVRPHVGFHNASVGVHTRGFEQLPATIDTSDYDWAGEARTFGASVSAAGVVLPEMPWVGVAGGPAWSLAARARIHMDMNPDDPDDFVLVDQVLSRNDPEVLAVLPTAQNGWRYSVLIHVNY